jgi:N-acyl-L-homoserine lactone synthetase
MTQKESRKERKKTHETPRPDLLDETLNDSFPASDPPSHPGIISIVGRYPVNREKEPK